MDDAVDRLLGRILRPKQPGLARCVRAAEEHLIQREAAREEKGREVAAYAQRAAEIARGVRAQGTGRVPCALTDLERRARSAAGAIGPEEREALRHLWTRLAPERWIAGPGPSLGGERATPPSVEAVVALASDPEGIEAAEAAAIALADAGVPWGIALGRRISWRVVRAPCVELSIAKTFAAPLDALEASLSTAGIAHVAHQRAHRLRRRVRRASDPAAAPASGSVLRSLGEAVFWDALWTAAVEHDLRVSPDGPLAGVRFTDLASPVRPVLAIWETGYTPSLASPSEIVLEARSPELNVVVPRG